MRTDYHQYVAKIASDFLCKVVNSFEKVNKSLNSDMFDTYQLVYNFNKFNTVDVYLLSDTRKSHDKNAVKVLVNNIFVGYLLAIIERQDSSYISNLNYRYDTIFTFRQ